jgi:hypothetical protein
LREAAGQWCALKAPIFLELADNVPVVITELFEVLLEGRHESKRTHGGI